MRRIDAIDFFYLSMPTILDIGDGGQDALLVRVVAGDQVGWGECEAAPLPTIASLVCPMSHSACKPVQASVLGQPLDDPDDIARIHREVRLNSMDLLQSSHALSGIDIALWDLLGKLKSQPVYELLGFAKAHPKVPYCSLLFGDTPEETRLKANEAQRQGYRAVKLGWGPFGHQTLREDVDQVEAAREGLGPDGILCIDVGTVWEADVEAAAQRLTVLEACDVTWLEEPFHTGALGAYRALADRSPKVRLAGGEGAHNEHLANLMIEYAGVGYVQIDAGRVGGITSAARVFEHARARGVTFVNHTFTTHLALSASIQAYAGAADQVLCEYPGSPTALARDLTLDHLERDDDGEIHLPERPGLGVDPDPETIRRYLVDTEIRVDGRVLYRTPTV
ncbi:MAG TPA: mandelate racemase/muconate lactonizing enzyme family protein [Anaerolineales bacterium]|nr:mandelate racemase/muconate lactonizing enzyme family protein [Anaerolineales bacterium]